MKKIRSSFGEFEVTNYYITDPAEAKQVASRLASARWVSGGLDIETAKIPKYKEHKNAGLDPYLSKIRLIQVYDGDAVYIFDMFKVPLETLKDLLYAKNWVAHYGIFEISHFTYNGFRDLDIGCSKIISQLIWNAEHSPYDPEPEEKELLEEEPDGMSKYRHNGHSLEDCCGRHFGIRLDKTLQTSDWGSPELSNAQIIYAGADAFMTFKLAKKMFPKLLGYKMERHYRLEKDMQHVVSSMQLNGFPVDWKLHEKFVNRWDEEQGQAHRDCYGYFGKTNIKSTKELEAWARHYFRKDPDILATWTKTPGGKNGVKKLSFNATSLERLKGHKPIAHLIKYKEYSKLLDTYGESWAENRHPVTGRVHCEFTLAETRTGRLSSRKPNLQQWPRGESRSIFTPGDGNLLVVADFSQIEVRIQAAMSNDPVLNKIFREDRDMYCEFGTAFYGRPIVKGVDKDERDFSKEAQLAFSYGMGAPTFCVRAGLALGKVIPIELGKKAKALYYRRYGKYIEWCDVIRHKCKDLGYARTVLGKVRHLNPDEVYTKGPNTYIQGSAAELTKIALVEIRKKGAALCNTAHDEALAVCRRGDQEEVIDIVNNAMNGAMKYMFPKAVSHEVAEAVAADSWYAAKLLM